MTQGVVADNWSLQDISTLLDSGFEDYDAGEIVFQENTHSYKPILSAVIQTEALFDFLADLILRDEILVEEKFTYTWDSENNPINEAKEVGVVRSFPFLSEEDKISSPRDRIIEHICSTDSIKIAHQKM